MNYSIFKFYRPTAMDPQGSPQDVQRCDLCMTTIADSYCDFCLVNLCKPCIGEHIIDEYDKHKIVPFRHRKSTLIYPKCGTHPHKICDLQCKNCNIVVCSSCLTSDQHKGHCFLEISEVYKTKKEIVKNDLERFENSISPSYEKHTFELENQLAYVEREYDRITTEISKRGEEWHREIDNIVNKMKTKVNEVKMYTKDFLQKHLNKAKQTQSQIKQTLLTLKSIEKSTEVSSTIEYSSEIKELSKPVQSIRLYLPTFTPKALDSEKLYSSFGEITPMYTGKNEKLVGKQLDKPGLASRESSILVFPIRLSNVEPF